MLRPSQLTLTEGYPRPQHCPLCISSDRAKKLLGQFSAGQLATVYEKLLNTFPPETDGWKAGGQMVGPRQELGDWRDAVLQRLD